MEKRSAQILKTISENQRIEVSRLAELLEVSPVTIRKDLDFLEERGLIKREHGFAILGSPDDIGNRLAVNYEIKRRIAQLAATLIKAGETVMIESGSCCTLLAEELAVGKKNITIITNSAFIANYIRKYSGIRLLLLGGDYQSISQVTVGPITRINLEEFFVDKLFIGADGFTQRTGFTGNDYSRAETVRDMARQSNNTFILTESRKFDQQGTVSLLPIEDVGGVFTDDGIPEAQERYLESRNVKVYKVPLHLPG
ncbi:MAG: DeoR/GlpR family DNA-binding transcription regulator [Spirochaetaceae bacterium]|jgi:DeoR/GlpR family transcriptional regulator of sugar metabolism|nr:DeoR/GlpR family DNA-binding transcription regulator [Spirochaetaceae bacterium]